MLFSSLSVMSDSLRPHGLQHASLVYPPLYPRVFSDSSPLSQQCFLTISSSAAPFSFCLQSFPSIRVFSSQLALHIRWPKYWSFSFRKSPSNEYSGLISFRIVGLILQSERISRISRVFSSIIIQKHQFFSAQLSL